MKFQDLPKLYRTQNADGGYIEFLGKLVELGSRTGMEIDVELVVLEVRERGNVIDKQGAD